MMGAEQARPSPRPSPSPHRTTSSTKLLRLTSVLLLGQTRSSRFCGVLGFFYRNPAFVMFVLIFQARFQIKLTSAIRRYSLIKFHFDESQLIPIRLAGKNNFSIMAQKQRCVQLSVEPSRALVDEKFKVLVQNAPPGAELTVRSHLHTEDKHNWEAFGHYICDSTGTLNLCEDPSLGGTYEGVEPMGLLWSLRPVPGSKPGLRMRKTNVETPLEVTLSVYQGHLSEGFPEHRALAAVLVERWYMAPGVQRIPVTEYNLTATLFLPPGPGPFPAVLDLWGGGGNLVEYRASLLASHGFAALALDYLTNKLTKTTGKMMKDDYFENAYKFLEQHPQIVGSRIAMWGLSFGTSMTFKMAAYSKVMKLRCAVCYSGSHVQPINGSVEEILNYFSENQEKTCINENQEVIWHDLLLPIPEDPALKVDMGRVQCPLLLVVGQDDQNWPAYVSAMDIKAMMEKAGNSHLLTVLTYPNAGHLIEPPYSPHTRTSIFRTVHTDVGELCMVLWGGQTLGHSRAQEDSWRKTLAFLREHLSSGGCHLHIKPLRPIT